MTYRLPKKKTKKGASTSTPETIVPVVETVPGVVVREDGKTRLPVIKSPVQASGIPALACSTCNLGVECQEYAEGYVCAYEERFSAFGQERDLTSIEHEMYLIAGDTLARYKLARVHEKVLSGGAASAEVTNLGNVALAQLRQIAELHRVRQSVRIQTETTAAGSKPGGILASLFGVGSGPVTKVSDTLELNPPETATVEERQTMTVELSQEGIKR